MASLKHSIVVCVPSDLRVCHYTSAAGIVSILQRHVLWASSAAFMNDANEMRSGALAFSDLFETRKGSLSIDEQEHVRDSGVLTGSGAFRNFLVSAAMDPDNLTLWRNYGESEVAYSIELDAHIHLIPLQITDAGEHPNPPAGYFDREQDFDPGTGESFYVGPDPDHVFTLGGSWDKVTYIASENDPKVLETFDKMIADHRMHASMGKGCWPYRCMH